MKRNILVWVIAMAAAGAAVVGESCTPTTECDYIDRDVPDPLHPTEDDVAYCWQGYDSLGLYTFRYEVGDADAGAGTGNIMFVEYPPNALEPAGAELVSRWSVDPAVSTPAGPVAALEMPDLPGLEFVQVQINSTTMIISTPELGSSALRRAVCKGFGFETSAKQCRGSASRP